MKGYAPLRTEKPASGTALGAIMKDCTCRPDLSGNVPSGIVLRACPERNGTERKSTAKSASGTALCAPGQTGERNRFRAVQYNGQYSLEVKRFSKAL